MIVITARSRVVPGRRNDFIMAVQPLIDASRAEAGCLSYDLVEDVSDGEVFCFLERWENEFAVERHNATEHFRRWMAVKPALVAESEVCRYRMA